MAHIPSKVPTKIKLKNVRKVIMTMRFLLTMQHSTAFFETSRNNSFDLHS